MDNPEKLKEQSRMDNPEKLKGQSRMDNPEKLKGQSIMDNPEKLKGQSRMDNPENTEGEIKNGQSRKYRSGNQEWTLQRNWRHRIHKTQDEDKQSKTQHNMCNVSCPEKSYKSIPSQYTDILILLYYIIHRSALLPLLNTYMFSPFYVYKNVVPMTYVIN
jgi:hypothetical protein